MKIRKIFLANLPRWNKGRHNGSINWKESIGLIIHFIYDDIEGDLKIVDCNSYGIYVRYNNENKHKIKAYNLAHCKIGEIIGKTTSEFKVQIGTHFYDDNRDIIIIDKEYRTIIKKNESKEKQKWYKYHCNKCGYEGWIIEHSLNRKQKSGCPACCPSPQIVVEGINDIPTTNPEMVKFFANGYEEAKMYTKGSNQRIYPICPDCGRIKDKLTKISHIFNTKSIGCICSDGIKYPNKFAFELLEQLNINFKTEYSPNWIKPKAYDFYFQLNDKEYILEMDGGFHNRNNNMSGRTADESKTIDDYKDEQARLYGIEVIRIDCDYQNKNKLEYVKKNIINNDKLNKLFDLSKIDWQKCEEFAMSNRVKEACGIKRDNPNMTAIDIGKIMKLSKSTITRYLKQGSKIWKWMNCNAQD